MWRFALAMAICGLGWPARSVEYVGVELVLAVDTSISVSADEYRLQMQGIADALRSDQVVGLIGQHPGGVAMTLVHWSLGSQNRQAVGWQLLSYPASVYAFASAVETAPRSGTGRGTSISDAILYSVKLIEKNSYAGDRRKIDLSGDSRHNSGPLPGFARDLAVAAEITVNGLILPDGDRDLAAYFHAYVIGGEDAFVMQAARDEDFATAMRRKLSRELGAVAALPVAPSGG